MSDENNSKSETPESKPAAGGQSTAENYIDEQLAQARKSLKNTRIGTGVVAAIVATYMIAVTTIISGYTDPDEATLQIMAIAKPQVDNYSQQALSEVESRIPQLLQGLPEQALAKIPEYRKDFQAKIVESMRTYAQKSSDDLGEQLDTYLEAHGDSIAEFIKTAEDPTAGQEFAKSITEQILEYLEHKTPDGESLREKLEISLIALQGIENHVAYLAKSDTLTKHEQNQRRVIAILVRTVEQELSRTPAGQNLLGL